MMVAVGGRGARRTSAGATRGKDRTMNDVSRLYLNCHLAGFSHWDGLALLDQIKPGVRLELRAEPDNPHDPSAIAALLDGRKIGYVPAS